MSLINDALKQAQKAQGQVPPVLPAGPGFQPAPNPANQQTWRGLGLVLLMVFALVALLGLFLLWQWRTLQSPPMMTLAPPVSAPVAKPPASPPAPSATAAPEPSQPSAPAPAPQTQPPPSPASSPEPSLSSPSPATNPPLAAAAPPAPPPPAPLKLQAIIFDPIRPSAMINGETYFVGDQLEPFRVTAISRASVKLVSETQTNVLSLHTD